MKMIIIWVQYVSPGTSSSHRTVGCPPVAMRMWGAVYFFPLTLTVGSGSLVNLAWPWIVWILAWNVEECDINTQNKWKKSSKDVYCILTYIILDWLKYKKCNMNLLCQDCCDKCDLGDQCKRPFWPWEFCKQKDKITDQRRVCVCLCYFNPYLLKEGKSSQLWSNNGFSSDTS